MKQAKRFFGLLLVMILSLALATTAFANGTGSITVDNPISSQTYTAYKIFDVAYNEGATKYSYTIDSSSKWFSTVQAYATENAGALTLTQVNGSTTYVVTKGESFSAASFADALKKAEVDGKTGTTLTVSGNSVKADNLELGYYFVTSTNGALCNLTTTNPTVTIHDKNDVPFEKTDDKMQGDVQVGDTVTYTITGKVPDTTGFTEYTYKITDTMSNGLTFQKDVKVEIGGMVITEECNVTSTPNEENPTGFELTVPVKDHQDKVNQPITVTYTAVVNENAVAVISKNSAKLEYSNNPANSENKGERTDEEKVYSSKIVIDKCETGSEDTKLPGAEFILYKNAESDTKQYYKWNDSSKKVEWVSNKGEATTKTTDNSGAASFDGLANGTYHLEETEAPAGYNLLENPVKVVVNGSDTNAGALTVTSRVENSTGTELPETGGIGTTIFYVMGSALALGALVLLVAKKRMNKN